MTRYYRVKKDTFMWQKGAIISNKDGGYRAVEDVWDRVPLNREYVTDHIIENFLNEDFFERVYPSTTDKMLFLTKEEIKKVYNKFAK